MAPRVRSSKLESRSARLRLPRRKKPYSVPIMRGVHLLYRRNKTAGPWMVRVCCDGEDWTRPLGIADDHDEADGVHVLTYWQAQDLARERVRVGKPMSDLSIKVLIERYRNDLEQRGRSVTNATRVLFHMEGLPRLASKAVNASSLGDDLREFRDQLAAKDIKVATVNRTLSVFRAALNAAADRYERITQRPWRAALRAVSGADTGVRNVILSDADRLKLRGAAYARDAGFGLLIDVLDETGARPSQAARLTADDVRDVVGGRRQPCLLMPVSAKGRGRKARTHIPVPITTELADRLKGRSPGLLLKRGDGVAWSSTNLSDCFNAAMKGVVFDNPARVTMYALRHTSIVRQLLARVPLRVVAALHDTSVAMIERNYSKFIADVSDEVARAALPRPPEVVPLGDRRASS
jgi:integrase